MKYTAVYTEDFVYYGVSSFNVKFKRIEQLPGETITDMLEREYIDNCLYLFEGHSKLHNEKQPTNTKRELMPDGRIMTIVDHRKK